MRLLLVALVVLGLALVPVMDGFSTNAAAECVVVNVEEGKVWVDPDCPHAQDRTVDH